MIQPKGFAKTDDLSHGRADSDRPAPWDSRCGTVPSAGRLPWPVQGNLRTPWSRSGWRPPTSD